MQITAQEHYDVAADSLFLLAPQLDMLGGEKRDRELLLQSLFKAMNGAKRFTLLERLLNELQEQDFVAISSTTQYPKRADCFHLLAQCVMKMGLIGKAETLRDYAYNLGYEQGGNGTNWGVCYKQRNY